MKTAVVIGSASGIGKSMVSVLKSQGILVFEGDILNTSISQTETSFHIDATDMVSVDTFLNNVMTKTSQNMHLQDMSKSSVLNSKKKG